MGRATTRHHLGRLHPRRRGHRRDHDQTIKRAIGDGGEWRTPGYFEQVNSVAAVERRIAPGDGQRRLALARGCRRGAAIGPRRGARWRRGRAAWSTPGRSGRAGHGGGTFAGRAMGRCRLRNRRPRAARTFGTRPRVSRCGAKDQGREVLAVALRFDGSALATAAADGVVRVRESRTGRVTQTLGGGSDREQGVTGVAFSPDGNTLLWSGPRRGGEHRRLVAAARCTLHVEPSPAQRNSGRSPINSTSAWRTAARWPCASA